MTIRYTKDHEWIRLDGAIATVGISVYAAEQLGDVVYVELPEIGKHVAEHGDMAVVESAKAASDVYAPVAGEVVAVNGKLSTEPDLVNQSAEGDGWFVKLKLADPKALDALMDEAAYAQYLKDVG
jgi:glycine cleavage system H protein